MLFFSIEGNDTCSVGQREMEYNSSNWDEGSIVYCGYCTLLCS